MKILNISKSKQLQEICSEVEDQAILQNNDETYVLMTLDKYNEMMKNIYQGAQKNED